MVGRSFRQDLSASILLEKRQTSSTNTERWIASRYGDDSDCIGSIVSRRARETLALAACCPQRHRNSPASRGTLIGPNSISTGPRSDRPLEEFSAPQAQNTGLHRSRRRPL